MDVKRTLLIATDRTKTDTKSIGGWLISTATGNSIAHGRDPIFGDTVSVHSRRS